MSPATLEKQAKKASVKGANTRKAEAKPAFEGFGYKETSDFSAVSLNRKEPTSKRVAIVRYGISNAPKMTKVNGEGITINVAEVLKGTVKDGVRHIADSLIPKARKYWEGMFGCELITQITKTMANDKSKVLEFTVRRAKEEKAS